MSSTLTQAIPFIEASNSGRKQRPKSVLIRLSETTSERGAALGIANNWHRNSSLMDSCHYVVDNELVYQCVPHNQIAYSSKFSSQGTISINVCAQPVFDPSFWLDPDYVTVLFRTAELTARLCNEYHIPVRYADLMQHRGWFRKGGIILAVKGGWPVERFLKAVTHLTN
jgi:N-acetylmuramoyl-L-alanine amidase CwlA